MLEEAQEDPLDAMLATHVRCYLITNQITSPTGPGSYEQANRPVPACTVAALQAQFDDLQRQVPLHIQELSTSPVTLGVLLLMMMLMTRDLV